MAISYYKDIYKYLTIKYPNTKVYVISDHHFFHNNIIQYDRNQFNGIDEMNQYIIDMHNKIVTEDDIVLFLGDFSFKRHEIKEILSAMNGHKFLLLGNHDKEYIVRQYSELGFEGLFSEPVKLNDCYLSHYPLNDEQQHSFHYELLLKEFENNKDGINYHGHVHSKENDNEGYLNVCCEAVNYRPLLIGVTGTNIEESKSPLLIETPLFNECLNLLKEKNNLPSTLLIIDYIYSLMLSSVVEYADSSVVYGSYSQYKKYGYGSNFGDLDVAIIYDETEKKKQNERRIKAYVDIIYEKLKDIEGIDLEYIKRYINMCAFNYQFSNGKGKFARGALDVNMVPINFYKSSDFIRVSDTSTIEKYIGREFNGLLDGYDLPHFVANFLTTNGDIANLILQIIYQKGNSAKKELALKKIKYIVKHYARTISIDNDDLDNIIARYYLRNITFFSTLRRNSDIDFIKDQTVDGIIEMVPYMLREKLDDIFSNPHSLYNSIVKEIKTVPNDEIITVSKTLVKKVSN